MALNKIAIYTVAITASFTVRAKTDVEAVALAQGWVKEDVTRLNYALSKVDGFEPSTTP